ncbi:MAG: A24 family peptidase [Planctomycetota bacterium]
MFENLPFAIQLFVLGLLGLATGIFANWAIYSWTWILFRPISPWQPPHAEESPRQSTDRIPIVGWIGRRRDESLYGRFFWLRPMLIEIGLTIFVPFFYFWLADGGLISHPSAPDIEPLLTYTWFGLLTPIIVLMCIATFIDFDEHTIPDMITVPGTLFALTFAALAPASRLPEVVSLNLQWALRPIDYLSPNIDEVTLPGKELIVLAIALVIFAIWIWALLPKLSPFDVGWIKATRLMCAHIVRPRRKTTCAVRTTPRSMPMISRALLALLVVGWLAIVTGWSFLADENWQSLCGSLVGLAFGGGMIWSIRIVGTMAMGRQAMGFGDVTLMAMIGATLGWQATLLAFVYTVVLIVVMLVIQIIATGSQELPFGPYLCGGAILLIFRWGTTWPAAAQGLFSLGVILLYILLACTALLGVMLLGLQWIKGLFGGAEISDED